MLLLGRKAVTNLDSGLKSRNITLQTKVHIVKVMVSPVVIHDLKVINSSAHSLLYDPVLISINDYWKNHSFDYMDLCQQSDVSAF